MPWLETAPMDQRSRFIDAYRVGGFSMTELCARFQVSRRVGYKWVARYDDEGRKGLAPRVTSSSSSWPNVSCIASCAPVPAASSASFVG